MGELVIDFFSRTMEIINKMQIHDNKTGDITIIKKIIQSLTPKFNFIMSSIEIKKDKNIDELSIDELQSSLLIHEKKLNQQDKKEQALGVLSNNHFLGGEGRGRRTNNNNGRFSHQKFKDNHSSNSQTRKKKI
jgi:hypothetical protein